MQQFKIRKYAEVKNEHSEWVDLTATVLRHGFGHDSLQVRDFYFTGHATGEYDIHFTPQAKKEQLNFEARVSWEERELKGRIRELELMLPEKEVSGAYDVGDQYRFYLDLKTIVASATQELFVVDAYLDTELFDVYMESVNPSVSIRVLTNKSSTPLQAVAQKFAIGRKFEIRSSSDIHDRVVFADARSWVIGQSIKDAAKKKPTYIIEFPDAGMLKAMHEPIWNAASVIAKS